MVLDARVDIEIVDSQGWTALHCAPYRHHSEVGSILLGCGTRTHTKNFRGWNALDISVYVGSRPFVNLLGNSCSLYLPTTIGAMRLQGSCDFCRRVSQQ
jgi:ankyrin repeat protein